MSAVLASDDEDDIWNYKSSMSRRGKSQGSTSKNTIPTKTKEKEGAVVDLIDSDDDFPLTNIKTKPISNEKSAVQWASMFSKKKKKQDSNCDIHKDKNDIRKSKRNSLFSQSRSPLKTKTNQPRNSDDLKISKKRKEVASDDSSGIMQYLSPTKTSSKKAKLSDSEEESSNSSDQSCELIPYSIPNYSVERDNLGASTSSSSQELTADQSESVSTVVNDEGHINETDFVGVGDEPRIVDVIVVDDESEISGVGNKSYSISAVTDSDSDLIDTVKEPAGGFVRDDNEFNPPSQPSESGSSCIHTDERLTMPSSSKKLDNDFKSNIAISADPPIPPSTAARKQVSITSFFSSKAPLLTSKAKSDADQRYNNEIKSVVKRKSVPHLAKSLTEPSTKNPTTSSMVAPSESYGNKQYRGRQRQCPFYKRIPGTSFTVDAFRYGDIPDCNAYFLTHFHYDHYGGLTKKFCHPIYCSLVTGNLVERRLGVDKKWIHRLPMWKPVTVEGVNLTLMEANHCPGAVIVLFETQNGKKILHTGDFRASKEMEEYPALKNIVVDELYLDTTYCNPSYAFPSQKTVINFAVSLVEKQIAINPMTLIVSGAYTIGKERIFTAIAEALDSKICVMSDKKKVLDCLDDEDLKKRVTLNWADGQVHVLPMAKLKPEPLFEHHTRHSRYTSILAFEPTGWTHSNKAISLENLQPKWSKNGVTLYGVPYSEHSSYLELKQFVQFIRPKKILPTVNNGNAAARKKMENIFDEWLSE